MEPASWGLARQRAVLAAALRSPLSDTEIDVARHSAASRARLEAVLAADGGARAGGAAGEAVEYGLGGGEGGGEGGLAGAASGAGPGGLLSADASMAVEVEAALAAAAAASAGMGGGGEMGGAREGAWGWGLQQSGTGWAVRSAQGPVAASLAGVWDGPGRPRCALDSHSQPTPAAPDLIDWREPAAAAERGERAGLGPSSARAAGPSHVHAGGVAAGGPAPQPPAAPVAHSVTEWDGPLGGWLGGHPHAHAQLSGGAAAGADLLGDELAAGHGTGGGGGDWSAASAGHAAGAGLAGSGAGAWLPGGSGSGSGLGAHGSGLGGNGGGGPGLLGEYAELLAEPGVLLPGMGGGVGSGHAGGDLLLD
jgi:hypothetical protein